MAEVHDRSWLRNLFVIPLIVGLLTVIATFVLPLIFKDKNQISYTIEGPIQYLKDMPAKDITIEIKGIRTPAIYGYRARIWNSGDKPLKQVPITIAFSPEDKEFRILNIQHATKPEREFGVIKDHSESEYVHRFVYEYLNPGNEDLINILSTKPLNLTAYTNPEGVSVKPVQAATQTTWWASGSLMPVIILLSTTLASLLSTALANLYEKIHR